MWKKTKCEDYLILMFSYKSKEKSADTSEKSDTSEQVFSDLTTTLIIYNNLSKLNSTSNAMLSTTLLIQAVS